MQNNNNNNKNKPLIYIIAGENSGDFLGAKLIDSLKQQTNNNISFAGIGGPQMQQSGLPKSLFPFHELSVMGFWEIIPHLLGLYRRFKQTIYNISTLQPDCVITIDSPGFCFRLARKLRTTPETRNIPLIHYVAPTVWAYKPKRAQQISKLYNLILLILPFEPPYFDAVNMANRFVGHQIIHDWRKNSGNANLFREQYGILPNATILGLFPGSRKIEIKRHMPILAETIRRIYESFPQLTTAILTTDNLQPMIEQYIADWPGQVILVTDQSLKKHMLASCTVAISKSGTIALELSAAKVPIVVTYRVSPISAWLLKRMIKVDYVNIINLILDRPVIPELLQENCVPDKICKELEELLTNPQKRNMQITQAQQAITLLDEPNAAQSPSDKAAATIIELLNKYNPISV